MIGMSIGRYTILEKLGEGGMATVFRAFDTRLEYDVALKIIRKELFGSAVLEQLYRRFEREARVLARLDDLHIVRVLDYGEFEGAPYFVMQYVPGGTLKSRLGRCWSWEEAVRLLLPVACALDYAHDKGVLHRDVKPANILITHKGEPLLSDFGIAKIIEGNAGETLTTTGVGIGTPQYMAPEQGMGDAVDGRADVYALGVVLYELVTGRRPFEADTPMAVLLKQINDPLPLPSQFVPGLPGSVERVIIKALAKRPEDRYTSMGEFVAALGGLASASTAGPAVEEPTLPVIPGGLEHPGRPRASHRWWYLAAGGIFLLVVVALLWLGPGRIASARDAFLTLATRTISRILPATTTPTLQSIPMPVMTATVTPFPTPLGGGSGKIAFESNRDGDYEIFVMDVDGSSPVNITNNNFDDSSPAWSPDGKKIVFSSGSNYFTDFYIINSEDSYMVNLTNSIVNNFYPSWSPDEGKIIFASDLDLNMEIFIMNVDGSGPTNITKYAGYDNHPAWSPDGQKIAFTSFRNGNSDIYLMNLDGSYLDNLTNDISYDNNPAWSPDGGKIAFRSDRDGNNEIYLMNVDGRNLVRLTVNPADDDSPTWSPDGKYIAFHSNRDGNYEIYVMNVDGSNQVNLTNHPAGDFSPDWAPVKDYP